MCCGTKRQVEIACPTTCVYLAVARSHPPAVVKRQRDRDLDALVGFLQGLTDPQAALLLTILPILDQPASPDLLRPRDADVAEACAALAATFETALRGVIYQHTPQTLPAQRIAAELSRRLSSMFENRTRAIEGDLAVVLRRIEHAARSASKTVGPGDTAFLDLLGRLRRWQQEEAPTDESTEPRIQPSRLIVP